MKTIITFLFFLLVFFYGYSQNTVIPDVNFEKALIDLGYDSGSTDGFVPTANINTITFLNVPGKNIVDLQGIQDFTALTSLNCSNNNITDLKISNNKLLEAFYCDSNTIASLNLDENTDLIELFCNNNALSELDLTNNTKLTTLDAHNNQLTSLNVKNDNNGSIIFFEARNNPNLTCIEVDNVVYSTTNWTNIDVQTEFKENCAAMAYIPDDNFEKALIDLGYDTGNPDDFVPIANIENITALDVSNKSIADLSGIEYFSALEVLDCSDNGLITLNFTKNYALLGLTCDNNILSELNVSQNNLLRNLSCHNNELTSLDLTKNGNLDVLICFDNLITDLDLTQNSSLFRLFCRNNNLTSLNVKNGNNTLINRFDVLNNPNLTCIEVDNVAYSTTYWTSIDPQTGFSEKCATLSIDDFLESSISLYPNPTDNLVTIKFNNSIEIESIKTFDILGKQLNKTRNNIVDLSDFQSGLYFIKMETNKGSLTKKIIKI